MTVIELKDLLRKKNLKTSGRKKELISRLRNAKKVYKKVYKKPRKLNSSDVGQIKFVKLPRNKRPQPRWIEKQRSDGRFIVRNPHIGVRYRDMNLKRPSDFGKPTLLPIDASILR